MWTQGNSWSAWQRCVKAKALWFQWVVVTGLNRKSSGGPQDPAFWRPGGPRPHPTLIPLVTSHQGRRSWASSALPCTPPSLLCPLAAQEALASDSLSPTPQPSMRSGQSHHHQLPAAPVPPWGHRRPQTPGRARPHLAWGALQRTASLGPMGQQMDMGKRLQGPTGLPTVGCCHPPLGGTGDAITTSWTGPACWWWRPWRVGWWTSRDSSQGPLPKSQHSSRHAQSTGLSWWPWISSMCHCWSSSLLPRAAQQRLRLCPLAPGPRPQPCRAPGSCLPPSSRPPATPSRSWCSACWPQSSPSSAPDLQ
ncbi:uncharacterized protein LOC102372119 [Alligator sinensis]|uniref:Uncharacterized protein LOC102372119 n=1 Tax=Alligator sinensis TaxID=38654 RepID=A0A1U7SWC2_ALLSI|nr:uncharacterized protein LOC102372119 [Alligator sinensis]